MTRAAGRLPVGYSRIGDDVATIPVAGRRAVVKVDMLVGKTDVPQGMTFRQAARKAVAMCVSDFAAKGVKPDSFLVSIGLPRGTAESDVAQLAAGFSEASKTWEVRLVGGDTGEASDLVVDCVMLGFADKIVGRDGARPGEIVVTTGNFGYPPSGLAILLRGASATRGFRGTAVESVFLPSPNLDAGIALGSYLSSSMDSSDGLAICLHDIATMSRVGVTLEKLPVDGAVRSFARSNGLRLEKLVLGGGEEYLIVGTVKRSRFRAAREAARAAGSDLIAIGTVTDRKGIVEFNESGRTRRIPRLGWTHLG